MNSTDPVLIDAALYHWTRRHVEDELSRQTYFHAARGWAPCGPRQYVATPETIAANVMSSVTSGCEAGPWEDCSPWEQETAVAVAQRTIAQAHPRT